MRGVPKGHALVPSQNLFITPHVNYLDPEINAVVSKLADLLAGSLNLALMLEYLQGT